MGVTAKRVRRVDRTVSESSGSISSLSNCHLSFLVLYNKDMKIESEKAQVRISSLSNYQSLTFVLCSNDMKIKIEKALVRIWSLCVQHMPEAHVPEQLPVFDL